MGWPGCVDDVVWNALTSRSPRFILRRMTPTQSTADVTTRTEADQEYQALLDSAIAELESSEADLDELDSSNRDSYAYKPTVEAMYIAYGTRLKPDGDNDL